MQLKTGSVVEQFSSRPKCEGRSEECDERRDVAAVEDLSHAHECADQPNEGAKQKKDKALKFVHDTVSRLLRTVPGCSDEVLAVG